MTWPTVRTALVIALFAWNGIAAWYRGVWVDTALALMYTLCLIVVAWQSRRKNRS